MMFKHTHTQIFICVCVCYIQREGYIQKAWLGNEKFYVFWEEINFMEKVDEVVVNFPQSAEWEENILNFPGQMPNVSENL